MLALKLRTNYGCIVVIPLNSFRVVAACLLQYFSMSEPRAAVLLNAPLPLLSVFPPVNLFINPHCSLLRPASFF